MGYWVLMSDQHTLKSFEIRHLECCFIRTEGVKWKFIWKKMSCFVMHRLVCTPDHWLPIYIKYTYKHTSPAVPLIKLCTPTNRARIHPRGAFFLNLSIILVQFNNMQGPLTVPYQGHSNDETLRKSKPTKKKTQMSLQKRGTLQKRRQEVLVFNTTGVLQGEDKQKYTTTKEVPGLIYKQPLKQLWGHFIKTRCVPLRPKTGTESKTKKSAIYLSEFQKSRQLQLWLNISISYFLYK